MTIAAARVNATVYLKIMRSPRRTQDEIPRLIASIWPPAACLADPACFPATRSRHVPRNVLRIQPIAPATYQSCPAAPRASRVGFALSRLRRGGSLSRQISVLIPAMPHGIGRGPGRRSSPKQGPQDCACVTVLTFPRLAWNGPSVAAWDSAQIAGPNWPTGCST